MPPALDWPAADSQATPTLALQCDLPPLALQRRRRAPWHSGAAPLVAWSPALQSSAARRPYCYVVVRGPAGALARTPTRATVRPTATNALCGVVRGAAYPYMQPTAA